MIDPTRRRAAIEAVARHIVATAVEHYLDDDRWGDYAELGEHDFKAAADRARALTPYPDDYNSAYLFLEELAD
jgi:hypothetical protein